MVHGDGFLCGVVEEDLDCHLKLPPAGLVDLVRGLGDYPDGGGVALVQLEVDFLHEDAQILTLEGSEIARPRVGVAVFVSLLPEIFGSVAINDGFHQHNSFPPRVPLYRLCHFTRAWRFVRMGGARTWRSCMPVVCHTLCQ